MDCTNLLVRVELGQSNASLLAAVSQLAGMFKACVTGIALCQPMPVGYSSGYVPEALFEQDRANIEAAMAAAESEFRTVLAPLGQEIAWRSAIVFTTLSHALAREARAADLIVTGLSHQHSLFDGSRYVDVGDLAMNAGRPCLILPDTITRLDASHVVVAWKDTAEARRAARDALPLLRIAERVTVIELAAPDDLKLARMHVDDVVAWLARHRVRADGVVDELLDETAQLSARLAGDDAGVIVAGAYGHSRLREWVFGGVTRNLLLGGTHCALVSH